MAQPVDDAKPSTSTGRFINRVFGSKSFFRLWLAQVISGIGDWLGFIAIAALAAKVGVSDSSSETGAVGGLAISVVLAARLIPGFFLAPVAGVLVDYWDRRIVMIVCDIGRAGVMISLPFVDTLPGLVFASFVLELLTLLWAPAKEASVPNLVPKDKLTNANSLSLMAAYGTFPLASLLFAGLATVASWVHGSGWTSSLRLDQAGLAFYVDALTFLVTAAIVFTLTIPPPERSTEATASGLATVGRTWRDLREGWSMAFLNPVVRAVILGFGTALIGGAMVIPLGPGFAHDALSAETDAAYGWLLFGLGLGVALGILGVTVVQNRLPKVPMFVAVIFVGGGALIGAASSSLLLLAIVFALILGFSTGATYVLAMTLLHTYVDDELRGRVFATFFTLMRMSVLLAMLIGPLVGEALDGFLPDEIELGGATIELIDERLALWFGGIIVLLAGMAAAASLRAGRVVHERAA